MTYLVVLLSNALRLHPVPKKVTRSTSSEYEFFNLKLTMETKEGAFSIATFDCRKTNSRDHV